jgi:hypothetical protein
MPLFLQPSLQPGDTSGTCSTTCPRRPGWSENSARLVLKKGFLQSNRGMNQSQGSRANRRSQSFQAAQAGSVPPAARGTSYSAATMAARPETAPAKSLHEFVFVRSFQNQPESCIFIAAGPANFGLLPGMGGKSA